MRKINLFQFPFSLVLLYSFFQSFQKRFNKGSRFRPTFQRNHKKTKKRGDFGKIIGDPMARKGWERQLFLRPFSCDNLRALMGHSARKGAARLTFRIASKKSQNARSTDSFYEDKNERTLFRAHAFLSKEKGSHLSAPSGDIFAFTLA